ncbi:uncharacterized protein BX664DRAFT_313826 [Halteromyces radiatus]|uniref:uncharacterized protein n=1 Tax=Halteromyces radiatus TaxID=101107 RepID=UPI00221F7633|nr:uncharacterized protein BX664DRAFT_313826 [Halteromyces radiatus]KAI8093814.1 hypothetical protein BX664DRAFT_313826 [Halteromyces radiatus]
MDQLFNQTFILWRSTPLIQFAKKTRQELVNSLALFLSDAVDMVIGDGVGEPNPTRNILLDIDFEYMKINGWDSVDKTSLPIDFQIKIWYKNRQNPTKHQIYLLPATVPRNNNNNNGNDPMLDAKDYPLILTRFNNKQMADIVQQWLQTEFGCHITKFHTSGGIMKALVDWWTSSLIKKYDFEANETLPPQYALELTYNLSFSEQLSSITINVSMEELRKMQNLLQKTDLTMMELLEEHLYDTLRIKIDYCTLSCVGTPVAYISNNSQMKLLTNGGSRTQYLEFLSELCDLAGTTF